MRFLVSSTGIEPYTPRLRQLGRNGLAGAGIILIPLCITIYAWAILSQSFQREAQAKFEALALESEKALLSRIQSYSHALVVGESFIRNVEHISGEKWRSYVHNVNLPRNFPGLRGLGIIRRVEPTQVEDFLAKMRADGAPGINVHPQTADLPLYIVTHVEPIAGNGPAVGLNVAFERKRREAAELALDSGLPALTGKIVLVQDQTENVGFLLLRPMFDGEGIPLSYAEINRRFRGWIYAEFIAKDFMNDLTQSQNRLLNISVYDGESETNDNLIFADSPAKSTLAAAFSVRRSHDVAQRRWKIVWASTPAFEASEEHHEAEAVLGGGIVFTACLGAFLLYAARRRATIERQHLQLEMAKAQLSRTNDELEARVATRTAELQAAQLAAEAASQAKTEFLSNMSHELRTPMHAVLGYAELGFTEIGEVDIETLGTYFENINKAGTRLLGLLNGLLDLAALEAGKIIFKRSPQDFADVIRLSQIELAPLLEAKHLTLTTKITAGSTTSVFDKQRMTQVLINLISNSIKFSPSGSDISVALSDSSLPDGGDALCCSISDEGPGIPGGELEAIFDRFIQSSKTKSGAGGTGLGLSICQEILKAHSGKIWVENRDPHGAVFTFVIPRNQA